MNELLKAMTYRDQTAATSVHFPLFSRSSTFPPYKLVSVGGWHSSTVTRFITLCTNHLHDNPWSGKRRSILHDPPVTPLRGEANGHSLEELGRALEYDPADEL